MKFPCMSSLTVVLTSGCWAAAADALFVRADANVDGQVDISDGVKVLNVLFLGDAPEGCDDAMDSNDDGKTDISDGVWILNFLFLGGPKSPQPYPDCGPDPTLDDLGCAAYPFCADCLDEAELDAILAEQAGGTQCIPAGEITGTFGTLTITVCPVDSAGPCGADGARGCPLEFTKVDGSLDIPARILRIRIEGAVRDLPLTVVSSFPPGETTCTNQIQFRGDVVLPFEAAANPDGTFTVLDLGVPAIENETVSLESSGGLLCELLESQQDQLAAELVAQLEATAAELVEDLKPELVGQVLCAP
ncbi:MAG: hypothetical protein ACUVYA_15725 [Planctomycetota bacterium]